MNKLQKYGPSVLCITVFLLCMAIRFAEYLLLEIDKTIIGENIIHKVLGIIILAVVLKSAKLTWSDIGLKKAHFICDIIKGLLLGAICFTISYGIEFAMLALQGDPAHLEVYISGFSLTGSQIQGTGFGVFALCILCNIINVWMEEGVFRGLFIQKLSEADHFMRANFISAVLFGIWHIVMPVKSYIDREMSFAAMVLMGLGYMVLAGIMGMKWGLLYRITGNIWVGCGDHLLNNTVATNMVHVVSQSGTNELQIVRIILAQAISFVLVLLIYRFKKWTRPEITSG